MYIEILLEVLLPNFCTWHTDYPEEQQRLALVVKDKANSQTSPDLCPCSSFDILSVALSLVAFPTCKMPFNLCLG